MELKRLALTALGAALVLSGLGSLFIINQLPGQVEAIELVDDPAVRRDEEADAPLAAVEDDDDGVTGDGDRTAGNDGTGGGNNTGDGDRTAGNDGTGGGNNTGDGDRTAGNDGTGGGNNTRFAASRDGGSRSGSRG